MYILASFISGIALFYIFRFFPVLTVSAFILSGVFLRKRFLLLFVIVIGFLYAFMRYIPPVDQSLMSGRDLVIDCATEGSSSELSPNRYGNKINIRSVKDAKTGGYLHDLYGKEAVVISAEGLKKDMRYEILAEAGKDTGRLNPGVLSSDRLYLNLTGIIKEEAFSRSRILSWFGDKREGLNNYFKDNFKGDTGVLLSAITTGEWSAMSDDLKDAFSATGLAHLLSISGTHFGLFSMLIFGISRLVIGSMPYRILQRFTIYLTPSQAAAIMSAPFMVMYLIISGSSIPAIRSFLMINIFLLGLLIGRKGFWLNSLLFAAFVICIWEPSAMLSISFQLSFLAVFFIGLVFGGRKTPLEERDLIEDDADKKSIGSRFLKIVKDSVLLTIFVSLGTAPLVAYCFHYFSVISPLANLIITPFIGFILVSLSLLSAFVFIFTGYYPFQPLVALASDLAIRAVKFFASMPFADIKIPAFPLIAVLLFYAGVVVFFRNRKLDRDWKLYIRISVFPATAAVFFLASLSSGNGLSVTYLDVGQGDSFVIETQDKKVIAIDTGRTGRELDSYLKFLGKRTIDALVITHADKDHSGGAQYLASRSRVKEIWDNSLLILPDAFKNIPVRRLERGDVIEGRGIIINILHPYKGFYTFSGSEAVAENNNSLVVKVTGVKESFLFTADTAEEAEEDMAHLGKWIKSDVLKVSHHGSRFSTTENFLKTVSPKIAVISVGKYNTYGHPHRDTLERLRGIRIYRTDRDGAIKIAEASEGLRVKTYKEFEFERAKDISAEWRNFKRLFMKW